MKDQHHNRLLLMLPVLLALGSGLNAQESEQELSADLSSERVTDAFQENFFEGMKQAAIENYDRAVEYLLKVPGGEEVAVVQFELARNYRKLNRYDRAEEHILRAVHMKPDNEWYWDELLSTFSPLGRAGWSSLRLEFPDLGDVDAAALIRAYTRKKMYGDALSALKIVGDQVLKKKLNDFISRKRGVGSSAQTEEPEEPSATGNTKADAGTVEEYRSLLDRLERQSDWQGVERTARKANREFPLQTDFAVYLGRALNQKQAYREARSVLEEARAYLIEETDPAARRLLEALLQAYVGLGDTRSAAGIEKILKPKSP